MTYQIRGNQHGVPVGVPETIADDTLSVLPVVPADWVYDAFQRVSPADYDRLRRFKIVPITWMPTKTIAAVVDEIGLAEAKRLGMPVVGRVLLTDYRKALRQHFGIPLLKQTTHHLQRLMPEASASSRVTPAQTLWFTVLWLSALLIWMLLGAGVLALLLGLASGGFFCMVITLRVLCLMPVRQPQRIRPPAPLDLSNLPIYTVLVPLFRETKVLRQLLNALAILSYPPQRLDIKLILEETDSGMQRAVGEMQLPSHFDVIVVPAGFPQTKPRALNYAMAFARGSLVTIYDSEDIPDPGQLLRAVQAFHEADEDVACLQARLRFYNPAENWLAQQFSTEYATLFDVMLPALADNGLPLLLGGTSNHFRMDCLKQVGGWDPFNVTEDADLGIRLARMGYRTQSLDSITHEEANIRVGNWLKQRRRWLKGFLQTWLVHNRHPIDTFRMLGLGGFCTMQCMTLGVFASALLHPFLVAAGIWCLLPAQLAGSQGLSLASVMAGLDLVLLVAGYATAAFAMKRAMQVAGLPSWPKMVLTLPIYWSLLSIAAWQAVFDFLIAPFHWHKTEHGLSWQMQQARPMQPRPPLRKRRIIYTPAQE